VKLSASNPRGCVDAEVASWEASCTYPRRSFLDGLVGGFVDPGVGRCAGRLSSMGLMATLAAAGKGASASTTAARTTARNAGPDTTNTTRLGSNANTHPPNVAPRVAPWLDDTVTAKVPSSWGSGRPNKKGVGTRWTDPRNQGNGIRIDQGDSLNTEVTQQVDHVVVRSGGEVIGRDGRPIVGTIKDNYDTAHIPLEEWLAWSSWNSP